MRGNPFTPGAGSAPPALVGRDQATDAYERLLDRTAESRPHQGIMVTGLRGVGKTVLLNEWFFIANQLGYRPMQLEASDNGKFLQHIAQATRRTLMQIDRGKMMGEHVRHAFAVLKSFSITIGNDGPKFGVDIDPAAGFADTGDPEFDLTDLFRAVGVAAQERQQTIVIIVDEMQYLDKSELGAFIGAFHSSVQHRLPMLVAGGGLPNLRALAGEAKTYAERLFQFPKIDVLSKEEVFQAVQEPAKKRGAEFSSDAIERIYDETKGYPYFVQEWAHDTWDAATGPKIGVEDVARATPAVLTRLDTGFFLVRLDQLTDREQLFLLAMAELGPGSHRSGEIARVYGAPVTAVAPIRDALIRQGMIFSAARGDTEFTVPLFDAFMRRTIPDIESLRSHVLGEKKQREAANGDAKG